jgi:hypothetical protein
MYLRGKEMRRRFVTQKGFIKPHYNLDEISVWSINHQAAIRSAQAYLTGFYQTDDSGFAGLANEPGKNQRPYPFSVGNSPYLHSTTFSIRTDAGMNWDQTMIMKGYEADICPFI